MGRVTATRRGRRVMRGHRAPARWARNVRPIPKPIMRVYRLKPDPDCPLPVIEVRLFRTRLAMLMGWAAAEGIDFLGYGDWACMGRCRSYGARHGLPKRPQLVWRHAVARIYLNAADVRWRPALIPVHELGHAAMAWARWRHANLGAMPGEEVMCYALGEMAEQLTNKLNAIGFYRGELR